MSSAAESGPGEGVSSWDEHDRVASRVRLTRLERALDWATSLVPSPFSVATSCCGMSLAQGGDLFEALGAGPPAVSARSADLLIVAGSLTRRQVPLLRGIYERMVAPRWVIAWGACAISGGPYDNYATVSGLSRILPVDIHVMGCPPAPEDLRAALAALRERATRDPARASRLRGWRPIESTGPADARTERS
ncbi:MAG: NADH-quinone oxidoreductase subunit NuoB [Deltaproteobacteria bacterium]|nr:NADH-quinone oxidoreductase subunit NuoB [Deltaproteobacteria bacterium]